MIVNEETAKTLACPFAWGFQPGNGDSPRCCASACMQWEWQDNPTLNGSQGYVDEHEVYQYPANFPSRIVATAGVPGETDDEYKARAVEVMTERGYSLVKPDADSRFPASWSRPNPNRRGQCGRTIIVEVQTG